MSAPCGADTSVVVGGGSLMAASTKLRGDKKEGLVGEGKVAKLQQSSIELPTTPRGNEPSSPCMFKTVTSGSYSYDNSASFDRKVSIEEENLHEERRIMLAPLIVVKGTAPPAAEPSQADLQAGVLLSMGTPKSSPFSALPREASDLSEAKEGRGTDSGSGSEPSSERGSRGTAKDQPLRPVTIERGPSVNSALTAPLLVPGTAAAVPPGGSGLGKRKASSPPPKPAGAASPPRTKIEDVALMEQLWGSPDSPSAGQLPAGKKVRFSDPPPPVSAAAGAPGAGAASTGAGAAGIAVGGSVSGATAAVGVAPVFGAIGGFSEIPATGATAVARRLAPSAPGSGLGWWNGAVKHCMGSSTVELFRLDLLVPQQVLEQLPPTIFVSKLAVRDRMKVGQDAMEVQCQTRRLSETQQKKVVHLAQNKFVAMCKLQMCSLTLVPVFDDASLSVRVAALVAMD